MTRISPKVIDVEGNRVETDDKLERIGGVYKTTNLGQLKDIERNWTGNKNGRFPTQLFTNIKNKQFKYVKNIT